MIVSKDVGTRGFVAQLLETAQMKFWWRWIRLAFVEYREEWIHERSQIVLIGLGVSPLHQNCGAFAQCF